MTGHLEVITGPMMSGKSEELIRRLRRAEIAKQRVVVFKPKIDDRYDENDVISHNGLRAKAIAVKDSNDLKSRCSWGNFNILAIDEIQFFDFEIFSVVEYFLSLNKRVIVSGLDMDFKKEPFGIVPELLAIAKFVDKLKAICQICGAEDAMYTQRLLNNKPAPLDSPVVIIGGKEQYEARCNQCWEAG